MALQTKFQRRKITWRKHGKKSYIPEKVVITVHKKEGTLEDRYLDGMAMKGLNSMYNHEQGRLSETLGYLFRFMLARWTWNCPRPEDKILQL